jgi:hypothetical protein
VAQSQKFLVDLDLQGNQLKNVVLGTTAGTANGAIWFDALTGLVKFIDAAGTTQSIAPEAYVDSAVADEAADRASEITRVEGLVSAEEAARILAVNAVASDLADEVSARQTAVSGVASDLADEVTAREAAVANVASDLADEVIARQNAVSNVASDLADEVTAREAAVANVASDLADEVLARESADSALDTRVAAVEADLAALDTNFATDAEVAAAVEVETNRALAAEGVLEEAILEEVADRQNAVTAVSNDLADEVTARQNAVTAVQENLDDEVLARQNAVTAVQENLDDEVTAREAAVAAVANDLADEVANRGTAITGVQNSIDDEVARAQLAEGAIASDLADEVTARGVAVSAVASDLADEVSRAQSAEFSLDSRLDEVEDTIPTLATVAGVAADIASEATRADAHADAAAAAAEAAAIAHADLIAQGLNVKEAVRTIVVFGPDFPLVTTGTYTAYSSLIFDFEEMEVVPNPADMGVALEVGDHVITYELEGSAAGNIYTVQSGAWTLREDWDNDTSKSGSFVFVEEGFYGGTAWASFEITTGPDAPYQSWSQMTGTANVYGDSTINVNGNEVSVNRQGMVLDHQMARKATATIGNGDDTSFTISHDLGDGNNAATDLVVSVKEVATGALVQAEIVIGTGSVTVTFNSAPATNAMKVTIIG